MTCFYKWNTSYTPMREIDNIVRLIKEHLEGKGQPSSEAELNELFERYPELIGLMEKMKRSQELKSALNNYKSIYNEQSQLKEEKMLERVLAGIRHKEPKKHTQAVLWKYAAAAALVIFSLAGLWALKDLTTKDAHPQTELGAHLLPGKNKAVLTLSNGQQVELSSEQEGIVISEQLTYSNGVPLLEHEQHPDNAMQMALTTPRGGQYQIVLPDGSKVWLNADSKLEYPRTFSADHRNVVLEGEAYFEVVENREKPFIVTTAKETVEVLGTNFNVSAYKDEPVSSVALIEGKVKISLPNQRSTIIYPGQQTLIDGSAMRVESVDVNECVSWKNGEFMFNNETLESAMRKLARWYNIEVDVAPSLQDISIWGSVSRYDNFDKVLRIIKMAEENIQFEVKGRRVTLMK
ncbi:FecR family protein [Parapedobacter deserti]|uniref:FecR family protein n=1 Tax=Parapedobacter deserti TaxID=1912957 RepID=A0ABV7JLE6_9SPHI